MAKRGRSKKIPAKEARSFQWLNKKLDKAIKKWGLMPPLTAREQTNDKMFDGRKARYD